MTLYLTALPEHNTPIRTSEWGLSGTMTTRNGAISSILEQLHQLKRKPDKTIYTVYSILNDQNALLKLEYRGHAYLVPKEDWWAEMYPSSYLTAIEKMLAWMDTVDEDFVKDPDWYINNS